MVARLTPAQMDTMTCSGVIRCLISPSTLAKEGSEAVMLGKREARERQERGKRGQYLGHHIRLDR